MRCPPSLLIFLPRRSELVPMSSQVEVEVPRRERIFARLEPKLVSRSFLLGFSDASGDPGDSSRMQNAKF